MTYEQSLAYLDSLIKFGIKFGLDRIRALASEFGDPQDRLRVIHVGGTNGKGSTCAFISSILREADYRTGLYLSPYVNDVRERIQVDGKLISKREFAELVAEIKPVADRISRSDLGPVTEFEVKTLMAYLHFARREVDFAVLEVGMGGRFDATNLVRPLVAVITNVSLDHTERLGTTVAKIAREKAGIIKNGSIVVTAAADERAWRVILNRCREEGVEVWRVIRSHAPKANSPSADVQFRLSSKPSRHPGPVEGAQESFSLNSGEVHLMGLTPGLRGRFQHVNAATAIAAALALERYEVRLPPKAIFAGVANAYLPGRLEVLRENPRLIIDGAHNPDAAANLASAVQSAFAFEKLILVIGMLNTHSVEGVLGHLAPIASKVIATQSKWHLARPAHEVAEAARTWCEDVEVIERVPDAVERAVSAAGKNDLVLATGSFYTIGEVPR